jgi:HEAT repeat protein
MIVGALVTLLQDPEGSIRYEAVSALRVQINLPGLAIEALVTLLQDPKQSVRSKAASILRGQTTLPGSAIKTLVKLLQHLDPLVRFMAASALRGQTNLPSQAIEALVTLLRHPEESVRYQAAHVLDRLDNFLLLIPKLDSMALQSLLQVWLRRKSVTCFVWNSNLYIDIHRKLQRIPLQFGQQALFEDAWLEAHDALRLPTFVALNSGR